MLKIFVIVSSLNSRVETMLKCRTNLVVTGFLAPPGGPIAARKIMSTKLILLVSFRSYLNSESSE